MAERVTVEVGGMSSGVYHYVRLTDYDVSEADVEDEARDAFDTLQGSPAGFGNFATTGSEVRSMPDYGAVWVEVGGYMRGGKPVKGYMARRYRRITYERQLKVGTSKGRDTRGGVRRNRWK